MKGSEKGGGALTKEAAEGATTVAVAIASGSSLAVAGLGAASSVVGAAVEVLVRRNRRRLERWFEEIAHELGKEPDVVRVEIEAQMATDGCDKVAATIVESVDRLLHTLDDAVIPSLGALAAAYIAMDAAPDVFFRGLAGTLQELSAGELLSLRQIASILASTDAEHLEVTYFRDLANDPNAAFELKIVARGSGGSETESRHPAPPDALRLFHLLKTHHLGTEGSAGFLNRYSGPFLLRTERTTMKRLHEHIVVR